MNKKGFSLVEIIIALSIIAIIGTTSFVGFNKIIKEVRITSLNQVEEEILNAFDIYLETNKEVSNQLYKSENALITPLQLLINEGLLDLSNTNISEKEIKENYIVSAFMTNDKNDKNCVNAKELKTVTSWDTSLTEPLYICTKSDKTDVTNDDYSIIEKILASEKQNKLYGDIYNSTESNENNCEFSYYLNPKLNYVKYKNNEGNYEDARILRTNMTDSFVLIKKNGFNDIFDNSSLPISYYKINCNEDNCIYYQRSFTCGGSKFDVKTKIDGGLLGLDNYIDAKEELAKGETNLDIRDINCARLSGMYSDLYSIIYLSDKEETKYCQGMTFYYEKFDKFDFPDLFTGIFPKPYDKESYSGESHFTNTPYIALKGKNLKKYKKIRLKTCVQIVSGEGTKGNPYILENKC